MSLEALQTKRHSRIFTRAVFIATLMLSGCQQQSVIAAENTPSSLAPKEANQAIPEQFVISIFNKDFTGSLEVVTNTDPSVSLEGSLFFRNFHCLRSVRYYSDSRSPQLSIVAKALGCPEDENATPKIIPYAKLGPGFQFIYRATR